MKVHISNKHHIPLPLVFSILFFSMLLTSSYRTLSQFEVFTSKMEHVFSSQRDLATNETESDKEIGEDITNLYVVESRKIKFVNNRVSKFPVHFTRLITSPAYDIHLPPPKTLFS